MDGFLYVASSGGRDILMSQTVAANNLANASTPGFREDLDFSMSAYMDQGGDSRVFAGGRKNLVNLDSGQVHMTNRSTDVAINGRGWISVIGDGDKEGYTRRGDLRLNEYGQLVNGAGNQILGEGGPIAIPAYSKLEIGVDGTISIVPLGQDPNTLVTVDRIKLVKPDDPGVLAKSADGLLRPEGGKELAADASVKLIPGSLESSNVNALTAMVDMIDMSRRFEYNQKMIQTAETMDQSSAQLMRMT